MKIPIMLTIMKFRPFVTVQKLIPGREYPHPSDTFPITRLKSTDTFLAVCIRPSKDPPGAVPALTLFLTF